MAFACHYGRSCCNPHFFATFEGFPPGNFFPKLEKVSLAQCRLKEHREIFTQKQGPFRPATARQPR